MRFLFNPISSQFNAAPPREIIYSDTAPAFPVEGTRWVNTLEIREYVFTFDANGTGYWVEVGIGSTGPQGDQGIQGEVGPQGIQGEVGPQGPAATVAVGTVTTGEPGTSVSVSNAGTSGAAVLDFTIPRGAVGQTGAVGPQGPQGIQGPKGDDGASVVLKGAVNFYADLPTTGNTQGDLYVVQNDGNGYVWDGADWVNVGQIRGPKGDTGLQGPAGPAPAGTGAVVVNNGVVGTPVGYGTANVASTLVQRDANGNFSAGTITANVTGNVTGSVTGGVSGNAGTATKLATARLINVSGDVTGTAQSFDGSANITIPTAITAGSIVNDDINAAANISDTKLATISTANKVSNSATTATSANTAFAIVARDANGNFSANQITANLTGNATTASSAAKLTTARTINGVSFDGSADITISNLPSATAAYLTVSPQDSVNEGGEINLRGAGSFADFRIDNFQGNARIHTLAAGKRLEVLGGAIYANGSADNFFQGNVGIGQTSPQQKLHIGQGHIRLDNGYGLTWSENSDGASIRFESVGDATGQSVLIFETTDNGDEPIAFRLTGANKLVVNSNGISVSGEVIATTQGGARAYIGGDGSNDIEIGSKDAATTMVHLWNPAAGRFMDVTAASVIATTLSGNVTGTNTVNKSFQASNSAIGDAAGSLNTLEVLGSGNAAMMTFHRPGAYAAYFGLDGDNQFKVGGWSMGAASHVLLHSGNFSSYAQPALGFTPVQQGGGVGQAGNKIYIGWSGSQLQLQVDNTNFGANWPINVPGVGVPAGAVMPFAMNSVPSGWLAANGAAVSRAVYATLFAAIGTTHGSGDGSTTFNLPNLQGIFVRGSGVQTVNGFTYDGGNVGGKQNDQIHDHHHEHADYYQATVVSITVGSASNFGSGSGKFGLNSLSWSYSDTGAQAARAANSNGIPGTSPYTGGPFALVWNGTAWVRRNPNNAGSETRPANISLLYCIKF